MKLQKSDKETKISGKKPTISNKGHNQLSPFCCVNAQAKGWRHVEEKGVESVVTSIENPIEKQKRIQVLKRNPSIVSSSICLANGDGEAGVGYNSSNGMEKKPGETREFSKDVSNAVKRIESHISALQPCSQIPHSTKTSAGVDGIAAKSVTPSITRSYDGDQPVFLGGLHREYDWRCQEAYGRASGDYYVHGLRVPMDQDGLAKRPRMMMMSRLSKENPLENQTSMPPQSPAEPGGHKSSRKKKLPVLQMPIKPTLLYHKPSSENRTEAKRKLLPRRHGGGSSGSYLSSPTHRQRITSSSSSLSSQTDTTSTTHESSLVESSSNTPYSISQYSRERVGATPRYRSGRQRNNEKVTGRLRRFKNKLGLIFHHHHHHHHHNRDGDRGNSHSMWKPLQKMFHHTNAHVVHEKMKKSIVANVPRKNHVGHFNTLVGGLLKHVGRPKIRKRIGRVGNKKVAKKLKWWQMFRRHGGVKLPKRRRVKVGFMRRKPQLKMS